MTLCHYISAIRIEIPLHHLVNFQAAPSSYSLISSGSSWLQRQSWPKWSKSLWIIHDTTPVWGTGAAAELLKLRDSVSKQSAVKNGKK